MQIVNKVLGLFFFIFYWAIPLSIGQDISNKIRPNAENSTSVKYQKVIKIITDNAPQIFFGDKNTGLNVNREGRHLAFDQLLAYFEQSKDYILIIRIKNSKELSKHRVAFLYSYIFKNTNLKAQQVEIKPYSPKDAAYFWAFENDELAISFDSIN